MPIARLNADGRIKADATFHLIGDTMSVFTKKGKFVSVAAAVAATALALTGCAQSATPTATYAAGDGVLKIGHGIVNGRRTIRLVCSNADLGDADLAAILAEIKAAARELPPGDNAVAG